MSNYKNDLYTLADLVEAVIGKDPKDIRLWVNTPITNIGTPRKLIESGDISSLILYLKGKANEKKEDSSQ